MVEITPHSKLRDSVKKDLDKIVESEFGHIPIVKSIKWATPDWTIIFYQENEIATFCNIVERTVLVDDKPFLVSGINNLITPHKFRGHGLATHIMKETENFLFNELKSELGLLLCADNLIPFYERLDWKKVNCPVYFSQPTGIQTWKANTMLRTMKDILTPNQINLNGLPW